MVTFKMKVYPFCVMVYAEEEANVKCNIARFDYGDGYWTRGQAIRRAEQEVKELEEMFGDSV